MDGRWGWVEFCWFLSSVTFVVRFLGRFLGRHACLWLERSQSSRVFWNTGTFPRTWCCNRVIPFDKHLKTVLWMWTSINAHAWFLNANCPNVNAISWPIDPTMETWLINSSYAMDTIFVSFAQWHYRSQWGSPEARLLLIENFSQYPAKTTWNIVGFAIFDGLCVGPTTN